MYTVYERISFRPIYVYHVASPPRSIDVDEEPLKFELDTNACDNEDSSYCRSSAASTLPGSEDMHKRIKWTWCFRVNY